MKLAQSLAQKTTNLEEVLKAACPEVAKEVCFVGIASVLLTLCGCRTL